ncbi:MAG: biopolymer transporter ExbD [Bacteroidia bacterium]
MIFKKLIFYDVTKKPKKHPPAIDMTAMVDQARLFLLLTFFILTTTRFREGTRRWEVDMPSSVSGSLPVPDVKLCILIY